MDTSYDHSIKASSCGSGKQPKLQLAIVAMITVLTLSTACSGKRIREEPTRVLIPNQDRPSYCVAMSGGGIRSGAVSLGALQGLHEADDLSKAEFISTISGGGYPVYGLLDHLLRKEAALAELLSESGEHIARVEDGAKFIDSSDIYSAVILGPSLWALLSWPTRGYGAGRPSYMAHIHSSFAGGLIPLWGTPKLERAKNIRTEGFPIPIFGTSASVGAGQPLSDYKYEAGHFFELSPTVSGAPKIGYFSTLAQEVDIAEAVAMSAAAIDAPQGVPTILKIWNMGLGGAFYAPTDTGSKIYFYLADGGFIENLGVLPLLRRGCREILAFDNSDDVAKPFAAWMDLEVRSSEEGWLVSKELRGASGSTVPTQDSDRWRLQDHIWDANLSRGEELVRVRLVKLGINKEMLQQYPDTVRDFAIENWEGAEPRCAGERLHRRCSFPLEATARQSFEKKEFRAYRHLGRWLAQLAIRTPGHFESAHESPPSDSVPAL